ncbi:Serine/threonine-protein kinase SMG1 [Nymphon striatum]|nr:Serine/threonine-protein kinase SMG1 [Nymphon striatum]
MDPTQSESVIEFTSNTLIGFHDFCVSPAHIGFCSNLLEQLIEDMESYTMGVLDPIDVVDSDKESWKPEDNVLKVFSMLRIYTVMMKSFGDYPSTTNWNFLKKHLQSIIDCTTRMCNENFSEAMFIHANSALLVLLPILHNEIVPQLDIIVSYIEQQSESLIKRPVTYILSVLSVVHSVIQAATTQLPLSFIPKIIGLNSSIYSCQSLSFNLVQKQLLKVYHGILSVKNVLFLEEAYRYILGDLQMACKVLIPEMMPLVQKNPFEVVSYTQAQAEIIALFYFCAFSEIGNMKNSIIGIWALKPSVFELLTTYISPTSKHLIIHYPAVHYALIVTLYSHCTRHNHYVCNSKLMSASTSNSNSSPSTPVISSGNCSPLMSPSTTSGHLTTILSILTELLESSLISHDIRILSLKWADDFIQSLISQQISLSILCRSCAFLSFVDALVSLILSSNASVCTIICQMLTVLTSSAKYELPPAIFKRCYESCVIRLNDFNSSVVDACVKLIVTIPLNFVSIHVEDASKKNSVIYQKKNKDTSKEGNDNLSINYKNIWTARRNHIMRGPIGTFHTHNFSSVMSFLFNNYNYRSDKNYHLEDKLMVSGSSNSRSLVWFWATWEAAQFCTLSKLRTPFGKAHETFTSIEAVVKNYAKEVRSLKSAGIVGSEERGKSKLEGGAVIQTKVILILHFFNYLEKLMYNAYEGCAVAMPSAPKLVKTFFRTNKATCREWVRRLRLSVATVALHSGQNAIAVEQGHRLLKEMSDSNNTAQGEDFEQVLMLTVQALIALKAPEPILGLYNWCKDKIGRKFIWLKAAVNDASGRYEIAIYEYNCILQNEEKSNQESRKSDGSEDEQKLVMDSNKENSDNVKLPIIPSLYDLPESLKIEFLEKQMTECYCKLSSWKDLLKWKESQSKIKHNNSGGLLHRHFAKNSQLDYIRALSKFENCGSGSNYFYNSKLDVTFFNHPDGVPWSNQYMIQKAERAIMAATLNYETVHKYGADDLKRVGLQAQKACDLLADALKSDSLIWPSGVQPDIIAMYQCASAVRDLLNRKKLTSIIVTDINSTELDKNSSMYNRALFWIGVWQNLASREHDTSGYIKYVNDMQLLCARLARRHQNDQLAQRILLDHAGLNMSNQGIRPTSLMQMLSLYSQQPLCENVISAQRESCKLLYSLGKSGNAVEMLSKSIFSTFQTFTLDYESFQINSSDVIKCKQLNARSFISLAKWLQYDSEVQNLLTINEPNDTAALALNNVVNLKSSAALSYAEVSDVEVLDVQPQNEGSMELSEKYVGHLYHLAIAQCPSLSKTWFNFANWCYKWGRKAVDTRMSTGEGAESIRRLLISSCPSLSTADDQYFDDLAEIWHSIRSRLYNFYALSARAYFKYLQLNGQKCSSTHKKEEVCEDGNVTATLRLLRLLVKHASGLRDVLEKGLAGTPTAPWKGIIPQLFSRLNHSETYVRQSISDLLCRIAQDSPHLIIFPAVVGNKDEKLNETNEDQNDEQHEDNKEKAFIMQNCFSAIVETLAKHDARTISEVKIFVQKVTQLESEVIKVKANPNLSDEDKDIIIREKHKTILKPSLFILEQLNKITSQEPETPHEKWFQEHFSKMISETMRNMKDPLDPTRPKLTWKSYKLLFQTLQQTVQKRVHRINSLTMSQISPKLALMKSTVIAMPGTHQSNNSNIITIGGVNNSISVLPTKTKPKKLVFHGSDGQRYTFLFKGLEDLHLDERIMQFLSIVNNMFTKIKSYSRELYNARHYSVTPLGPRSGLIQWVDGATPLFGLYKRWQQREAAALALKNQSGGTPNISRPSDIFYNKLTPLLKEKGITNLENRKEWPVYILKEVLQELMNETPDDLLANEIWCSSSSPNEWWNLTQKYAQSTAVMSMIGYIIGLGDRHLDNVLIDLATGEVVHIDYNVCFEKGKHLRVSEKVPFRMTPNIRTALGVTGIEVEKPLLTLLEAFVYDPLVDWTPGGTETGYAGAMYGGGGGVGNAGINTYQCERWNMEKEIAYNMLAMRVAEMKTDWLKNRDELRTNLEKLKTVLSNWITVKKTSVVKQMELESLNQQYEFLENIHEIEDHKIKSLSDRYIKFTVVQEKINKTKVAIEEKLRDCNQWQKSHEMALTKVKGDSLIKWINDISLFSHNYECFVTVDDFLMQAGQSQLLSQGEQVEKELKKLFKKLDEDVRKQIKILMTYSSIISQYPGTFSQHNRNCLSAQLLSSLNDNSNSIQCDQVLGIYNEIYGKDTLAPHSIKAVLNVQFQLQTHINSLERKLDSLVSNNEIANSSYWATTEKQMRVNLDDFIEKNGQIGKFASFYVVICALSALGKKLLMMEAAAAASGDQLVDLTSLEGDWFFHDVYNLNNNVINHMQLVQSHIQNPETNLVFDVMKAIKEVIDNIQKLNSEYQKSIQPEIISLICCQDPGILSIVNSIDKIINESNSELDTIITNMESHMRCLIMEMKVIIIFI